MIRFYPRDIGKWRDDTINIPYIVSSGNVRLDVWYKGTRDINIHRIMLMA